MLVSVGRGLQRHPITEDCFVRWTDLWGVAVDLEDDKPATDQPEPFSVEGMTTWPSVEKVLGEIFASVKLPRLGGVSSGRGWSSISTFQRCPKLWELKYLKKAQPFIVGYEAPALAIGTLVHVFLATYYRRMIEPTYPLDPKTIFDQLHAKANPELVMEGWRLFVAYGLYYKYENILPLAVEYDLKDPRSGESCRYDLIAFFPEDEAGSGKRGDGLMPGTYQLEHKTAGRFDQPTLHGWANDGEVIGQMMLLEKLHLDKRFGPLVGTIVNIIGKQKEPLFHRTIVSRASWQTEQHQVDLQSTEAQIRLAQASGNFSRSRANCIHRYGMCDYFDHCASEKS